MMIFSQLLLVLGVACSLLGADGRKASEDIKMEGDHQNNFQKFKDAVTSKIKCEEMKKDAYLAKVFHYSGKDVDKAIKEMEDILNWREENMIDKNAEKDWSELKKGLPYHLENEDKEGRPILYLLLGDFDFDKEVLERRANFLSFFYTAFELAARKALVHHSKGNDVSDYDLIVDLHGFTETKGACFVCLSFDGEVAGNLNSKWPRLLARMDFINASPVFDLVLNVIKPVLGKDINDNLHVIPADGKKIKEFLLGYIEEAQLPKDINGVEYDKTAFL